MPPSAALISPIVRITDHYIGGLHQEVFREQTERQLPRSGIAHQTTGTPLEMAEGYRPCTTKFVADPAMLDSAEAWLNRDHSVKSNEECAVSSPSFCPSAVQCTQWTGRQSDTAGLDGWTALSHRGGCLNMRRPPTCTTFLKRAVGQKPNLEFRGKYGLPLVCSARYQPPGASSWVLKEVLETTIGADQPRLSSCHQW